MCLDEVGVATVSPAAIQLIFVLVCPEIMEKKKKKQNKQANKPLKTCWEQRRVGDGSC